MTQHNTRAPHSPFSLPGQVNWEENSLSPYEKRVIGRVEGGQKLDWPCTVVCYRSLIWWTRVLERPHSPASPGCKTGKVQLANSKYAARTRVRTTGMTERAGCLSARYTRVRQKISLERHFSDNLIVIPEQQQQSG